MKRKPDVCTIILMAVSIIVSEVLFTVEYSIEIEVYNVANTELSSVNITFRDFAKII